MQSHTPEVLEILDEDGHVVGTMTRVDAEAANHVTQNVLVFIFDTSGRIWIQLRPKTKKHFAGLWDISTCGGVVHGETPAESAEREQFEEMGFKCTLEPVATFMNEFPGNNPGETYRRLSHLFIGVSDVQPQTNDEVDEFKALPYAELRADVEAHPEKYVPSFLIELDKAIPAYQSSLHAHREQS
jgi:isopentenyl-diphosphate delta-isomerase